MFNALRFIRYTFRAVPAYRPRHQKSFLRRHGLTILASFGGAVILTMPLWMILMGVI